MAKVIACKDVGFNCDGVIRAATADEALHMAAEHAKAEHGLEEITLEVVQRSKRSSTTHNLANGAVPVSSAVPHAGDRHRAGPIKKMRTLLTQILTAALLSRALVPCTNCNDSLVDGHVRSG